MNVPLIPRQSLFGNPDRTVVRINPDGAHLAWLAPDQGVMNVWVAPREDLAAARAITTDRLRGIRFLQWGYNSTHILYIQDQGGDENWRVYSAPVAGGEVKDLTPFVGVAAQIQHVSPRFPDEILVGLNNRLPQLHDLYRVNIVTGALTLLEENSGFMGYITHDDYRIVGAYAMTPEGGMNFFLKSAAGYELWESVPQEDMLTSNPIGLDYSGTHLFMTDSRGRDTGALFEVDLAAKTRRLLAEDPLADVDEIIIHPTQKHIQAVAFTYERRRWQVLDPALAPDLEYLRTVSPGELLLLNRSLDDRFWSLAYTLDNAPVQYYLYDRAARQARFLFTNRSALEGAPLAKMRSFVIEARDGLKLVGYYTLPLGSDVNDDGIPDQPLPMVFLPHGGPWGRDLWGYDPYHQWLANRGYAVMNVNFRSSTGFGKRFVNAGDKAWGTDIIRDQYDTVQWAIRQGIAAPDQVAIMGGSFGGYSTLAGLTFYPETYACGVDIVGPSNLITLLESVPEYWKPMLEMLTSRVGDHRTPEGRALLTAHSPLTHAARLCKPLLIGQGANDPRVKQAEADQIVKALQAKGIPVAYVLYPDEGHGFARPENNLSFTAVAEAFLARCLEGRYEPIGSDFQGASLQVPTGADQVPGLVEALSRRPAL
jgi:dipeptidyl aminopeptidase/acylaminoacyl peptidase